MINELIWTKERPTISGFYWCAKAQSNGRPSNPKISYLYADESISFWSELKPAKRRSRYQKYTPNFAREAKGLVDKWEWFAGPISEPVEA